MEIDPAIQQRLTYTNQTHLLAYWSELNAEQRKSLLHDISQVDFDRVQQAYEAIKHELNDETKKDEPVEMIDDVMEPIPEHMAGSVDQSSEEQLNEYRKRGLKAIADGSVCVLLLAGGQGTRLGKHDNVYQETFSWRFRSGLSEGHVRCGFAVEEISLSIAS